MKHPVRFVGLVTTVLFAAALAGCSGSAGTTTPRNRGKRHGRNDGARGTGGASGGGSGTGGTASAGTGGTTGRGGTGGTVAASAERVARAAPADTTGRGGTAAAAEQAARRIEHRRRAAEDSGGTAAAAVVRRRRERRQRRRDRRRGRHGHRRHGAAGTCTDNMQNGSETGVDCGGSCGACPNYKINGPNTGDTTGSGCNGGPAFMCVRDMVFSPEFKVAEADDFGSPTNPQFVYGVVGHDKDTGGLDTQSGSNSCCQCYQLVFTTPRDPVSGVAVPKPMIVQAFNTGAGGGKNFDIYMGAGGEGANTAGCSRQYTAYPTIGQPNNGGIRAQNVSQCVGAMNMYSSTSIATMSCQSAIAADCAMITASNASVQSTTQVSCTESNQVQNLYHLNWNVLAKRIECPANLTRVTGCKLNSQGLPAADPTAVDMNSASGKGFSSGYTTTTMQDCCRPTCAYKANVTGADATYKQYYTCDASGNPG